jgi:hypothetical protein
MRLYSGIPLAAIVVNNETLLSRQEVPVPELIKWFFCL